MADSLYGCGARAVTIFPGDFVVHRDRGIAQFVEEIRDPLRPEERALVLQFHGGAVHHVPPEERGKISRLKAADAAHPPKLTHLSALGQRRWFMRLESVRASTKQVAQGILRLYAERDEVIREPCSPDGDAFAKFEAAFPYAPTVDQQKCFEEVSRDMVHRQNPMDRLVCGESPVPPFSLLIYHALTDRAPLPAGDVGFGKTEVAFRAIYRAVLQGRQVALLAPTTVLAAQHFRTLQKRMPGVRVALLRGGSSQTPGGARARGMISNGEVQVVVGTHALLSKSVLFKKLELLVVDEEQRFGVGQKERLKIMARGVDVLTLTATPIPRTLQMSLSGLRDLSTLRTAPPGRKEIETHVVKDDDRLVRGAIEREMGRQGQTFYVVPRIDMIEGAIARIARLVPSAKVAVAHGRVQKVDTVIMDFSAGGYDVLVATSVIESGLDLPQANTIIVMNPQYFGLAALYQLRGRVGRSPRQAFSFFLYPRKTSITGGVVGRGSLISFFF